MKYTMFPDTFKMILGCPILLNFSCLSVHVQVLCVLHVKNPKKMRKIHKIIFYLFGEIHTIPFPK